MARYLVCYHLSIFEILANVSYVKEKVWIALNYSEEYEVLTFDSYGKLARIFSKEIETQNEEILEEIIEGLSNLAEHTD